jgi:Bacterial surface proteins containing Ig-like domains
MKKNKIIEPVRSIVNLTTLMIIITIAFTGCREEDDFVAVSGISDVQTTTIVNTPLTLTATVSPSSASSQTIVWSIKDAGTTGANITGGNTLTATSTGTVIVTTTITNGTSKNTPYTKDFTITVSTNFTVTGITVTPETSEVPKGFSLDLTATVNGDNLAETDKAVTWKVTGNNNQETVIHADGTLIIAEDETAENLIITATAIVDESKSGMATITVFEYQNSFYNNFDNAEIVEIEFMGEKTFCYYVDGLYIIENDIVIKNDNYEEDKTNSTNDISTKAAVVQHSDYGRLWPEGKVYYYISPELNFTTIFTGIHDAMREIRTATNGNIKFIELKTNKALNYKKKTQTRIIYDAVRSASHIGMLTKYDFQNIWMEKPEDALHEICHTLGLIHEHQRPDRDDHIIVHKDRVQKTNGEFDEEEYNSNYAIRSWTMLYYDEFDLQSVMMYDSYHKWVYGTTLSTLFKKFYVITDLDEKPLPIPNKDKLSSLDKKVLNKMYPTRNATADAFIHTDNIAPTSNSCLLKGELIYEGVPAVTDGNGEYGICYKEKNSNSPYSHKRATSKDADGVYTCQLSDLKPNTTYEAGAYVIQNGQTYYTTTPKVEFKTSQGGTEYYQGASGFVKFKYYHFYSDNAYIGRTEGSADSTFKVINGGGDQFYLDKIDATRYLIKYGNKYMVPVMPGRFSAVSAIRDGNYLKTADGTVVDLKNPNDYTFTFTFYETIGGKTYYIINLESISDWLDIPGYTGRNFFVAVDAYSLLLSVAEYKDASARKASFAIEEVHR